MARLKKVMLLSALLSRVILAKQAAKNRYRFIGIAEGAGMMPNLLYIWRNEQRYGMD